MLLSRKDDAVHRKSYHHIHNLITIRRGVQFLFLIITLFIGIKFYIFVGQLASGVPVTLDRPPGVEAFLPISALVSLKYFLSTGVINKIHPAGLIIFIMICFTAIVFKKVFCGWICPFGLLSDYLEKLHLYIFGKRIHLPQWLDVPLRGIKYLIAGFFLWSVFVRMPNVDLKQFIQSPYNTFADITMLKFFTNISIVSFFMITILIILSVIMHHFWCRYLCPYGAILGIIGFFSMGKIRRNDGNCIRCGKCEKVCPGVIPIMKEMKINSMECSACLRCVDVCPEKNAIDFSLFSGKIQMNQKKIAIILVAFFTLGITASKLSNRWRNNVPVHAYRQYVLHSKMRYDIPVKISREQMEQMIKIMQKMRKQNIR